MERALKILLIPLKGLPQRKYDLQVLDGIRTICHCVVEQRYLWFMTSRVESFFER